MSDLQNIDTHQKPEDMFPVLDSVDTFPVLASFGQAQESSTDGLSQTSKDALVAFETAYDLNSQSEAELFEQKITESIQYRRERDRQNTLDIMAKVVGRFKEDTAKRRVESQRLIQNYTPPNLQQLAGEPQQKSALPPSEDSE